MLSLRLGAGMAKAAMRRAATLVDSEKFTRPAKVQRGPGRICDQCGKPRPMRVEMTGDLLKDFKKIRAEELGARGRSAVGPAPAKART